MRTSTEKDFQAYGWPLTSVSLYKYLAKITLALNDDWPVVAGNLMKARNIWARLSRILGREWSNPQVTGMLFKAVVQVVLLFRLEMWVVTPHMGQALGGLQHRVARWITTRQPCRIIGVSWE